MGKKIDFKSCSDEEFVAFILKASAEQLESRADEMNAEQISLAIQNSSNEKTRALIVGLSQRPLLEATGKALNSAQFFDLLSHTLQIEDKHNWKLSPLLVGINAATFTDILIHASVKDRQILNHESITEPMQYQITRLVKEMKNRLHELGACADMLLIEPEKINIDSLTRKEALGFFEKIDQTAKEFYKLFDLTNQALEIAWNSKRLDLIESLNQIKDYCTRYLTLTLGNSGKPSTGLYALWENKLFGIYGNPNNSEDVEALSENEPAIEGIVKFSVWYLKDYYEMGLLPGIKSPKELDTEFREKLFDLARVTLETMGLCTVKDLKNSYIFSRKTLQEYIDQRKLKILT